MGIFLVKFSLFLVLTALVLIVNVDAQKLLRSETYMTVPQLITAAGYPVEKHRVHTEDGYILQLHRIPAGRRTARRSSVQKGKNAILIVHGLLGHSGDFIIMGPDRSLSYMLADAGYDVWMANLRGNLYTTHHNLTRNNPKFWEYSFHEHGKYDLPATIDKILKVTGLTKIFYIGYSMGTTSFFTMMSQKPEYNEKIISFVALAPAVYLDTIRPLAEFLLKTLNIVDSMRAQGMYSANVPQDVRDIFISGMCSGKSARDDICMRVISSIVGEDYEQNDWNMSPVILGRFQPASWRQLEHFGKIAITGEFVTWDGGISEAVKEYNLSNVKVPVLILYGENDQLTHKSQVLRLANKLNQTGVLEDMRPACGWPKFNHLDFTFAQDVGKLLNKPLISLIDSLYNKYSPS